MIKLDLGEKFTECTERTDYKPSMCILLYLPMSSFKRVKAQSAGLWVHWRRCQSQEEMGHAAMAGTYIIKTYGNNTCAFS